MLIRDFAGAWIEGYCYSGRFFTQGDGYLPTRELFMIDIDNSEAQGSRIADKVNIRIFICACNCSRRSF